MNKKTKLRKWSTKHDIHKVCSYATIVIIQSYPAISPLLASFATLKKPIAFLVNGDRDIYKFLSVAIPSQDAEIILVGDANFERKRYLVPFKHFYHWHLHNAAPRLTTKNLVITFGNWCTTSALLINNIQYEEIKRLTPDVENRYQAVSDADSHIGKRISTIQKKTEHMLEVKRYYQKADLSKPFLKGVGLNWSHQRLKNIVEIGVPAVVKLPGAFTKAYAFSRPTVVFVERDVIRSKFISVLSYLRLILKINSYCKELELDLVVKTKPRHYNALTWLIFSIARVSILPNYVPAQVFCFQPQCKGIVGFTSSAMSDRYKKPIISLALLTDFMSKPMTDNVRSMMERSENRNFYHFPKTLGELKTTMQKSMQ